MNQLSRRALLLSTAGAATALAGCSVPENPATEEPVAATSPGSGSPSRGGYVTPRIMPAGKGSGLADGVFPRDVAHFAGTTRIESPPQRVVVLATGQADGLLTLGLTPVGSTAAKGAETIPGYLLTQFPGQADALRAVTALGVRGEPNMEALAALEPDLVLLNAAGAEGKDTYLRISAVAPAVVTQGTGLHWKEDLLLMADALGRTAQAQGILDRHHAAAASFGAGVAGTPTVSLLRRNGDRIRIFCVASFGGSVLEDAGLARPVSQQATDTTSIDISEEKLADADGDWIFHAVQGGDQTKLTGLPLWPSLGAVTAGHAVTVDDDAFYLNTGPTAARLVLETIQQAIG